MSGTEAQPSRGRIEVAGLVKTYRRPRRAPGLRGAIRSLLSPAYEESNAVDGVDFAIAAGESIGYVGANGAGKSTTVKILAGVINPTRGSVRVNGFDPARQRLRNARQIGVVWGQRQQLWWDLPVRESFRALADIYEVDRARFRRTLPQLVELLEIDDLLSIPVRQLSLGQSSRANICAALLHEPPVLFLDEPTIGLDVLAKERVREALRAIRAERNTTILLTSHDLGDVEELCDRLIVLDHGKVVHDGPLREAVSMLAPMRRLRVTTHEPIEAKMLATTLGLSVEQPDPRQVMVEFAADRAVTEIVETVLARCEVADLSLEPASIEDVVRSMAASGRERARS